MTLDMDAIRKNFMDMDTEALVDEFLHHTEDYTPEALMYLEAELRSRGITKEKLEHQFGDGIPEGVDADKLVEVQTLHNPVTAVELQDYLEEHGVASYFSGEIFLMVQGDQAEKAARLIEQYFEEPADEELEEEEEK